MAFNFNISSLFGGSSFGSSNSSISNFYSSLGDYNIIRTGGYKKLLKAYYATQKADTSTKSSDSTSKSNEYLNSLTDQTMVTTKEKADKLSTSAAALTAKGTNSLFEKKYMTVTDEETGEKTTTKDYDRNAINTAVKNFVSDYNAAVKNSTNSTNYSVSSNGQYMARQTSVYKTSLENVGININADNTLSIDEDKFNAADVEDLKKVFNDTYSFAGETANRARMISQAASNASTSSLYGQNGGYVGYASSLFNWYS